MLDKSCVNVPGSQQWCPYGAFALFFLVLTHDKRLFENRHRFNVPHCHWKL